MYEKYLYFFFKKNQEKIENFFWNISKNIPKFLQNQGHRKHQKYSPEFSFEKFQDLYIFEYIESKN